MRDNTLQALNFAPKPSGNLTSLLAKLACHHNQTNVGYERVPEKCFFPPYLLSLTMMIIVVTSLLHLKIELCSLSLAGKLIPSLLVLS